MGILPNRGFPVLPYNTYIGCLNTESSTLPAIIYFLAEFIRLHIHCFYQKYIFIFYTMHNTAYQPYFLRFIPTKHIKFSFTSEPINFFCAYLVIICMAFNKLFLLFQFFLSMRLYLL